MNCDACNSNLIKRYRGEELYTFYCDDCIVYGYHNYMGFLFIEISYRKTFTIAPNNILIITNCCDDNLQVKFTNYSYSGNFLYIEKDSEQSCIDYLIKLKENLLLG